MADADRLSKAWKIILAKFGWNLFHANIVLELLHIYIEFRFPKVEGDSADLIKKLLSSRYVEF